jgi:hypothetical protein
MAKPVFAAGGVIPSAKKIFLHVENIINLPIDEQSQIGNSIPPARGLLANPCSNVSNNAKDLSNYQLHCEHVP